MNKLLLILVFCISSFCVKAQTSIYETGGRVGIGTSNPIAKLEVNSGAGLGPLRGVGPNGYILVDNVGSGNSYYQANTAHHFQGTQGTETLTILANGNVGIGSTSPVSKLDVSGMLHISYSEILNYPSLGGNYIGWNKSGGGGEANFVNNIAGGNIGGFTFDKTTNGTAFTRLLTISDNGNVGIGTSDPGSTLTVIGNFKVANGLNGFTYNGAADINLQFADRGTGGRAMVHDTGNKLALNYGGDFSGGTSIGPNVYLSAIDGGTSFISNGNLAIGTNDTKGNKLAVAGNIIAEQVTVKLHANWPDYVFAKDYELLSLKDLEKYLLKNKHLPYMPSAKEIDSSGQNLGQMNSNLLKNVEELTLHLIEKDKQLQQQEKVIKVQNARIEKLENAVNAILKKQ